MSSFLPNQIMKVNQFCWANIFHRRHINNFITVANLEKKSLMKNHKMQINKINYILSRNQFITHILCQLMINRPKLQGIQPEIDIHRTGSFSLFT